MSWFFGSSNGPAASMQTVFTVTWQKERLEVSMDPKEATLGMLKAYLGRCTPVPVEHMKLMHSGAIMKEDKRKLADYGIRHGSRVLLMGSTPKQEQSIAPLPRYQVLCGRIDGIVNAAQHLEQAFLNFKVLADRLHADRLQELKPLWRAMDAAQKQVLAFKHAESAPPPTGMRTSADKLRAGQTSTLYLSPLVDETAFTEKQLLMTYRFLAESLMCLILDLDGIPTEEDATGVVKVHRKQGVQCVQALATAVDRVATLLHLNEEASHEGK